MQDQYIYKMALNEIPNEMRFKSQWMVANKIEKIPLDKNLKKRGSNKDYCMSYEEAEKIVKESNNKLILSYFLDNDVLGIDLDNCINEVNGQIKEWANMILNQLPGSYIEHSPSMKGLRIFTLLDKKHINLMIKIDIFNVHQRFKKDIGKIEIYTCKKNLTVTGNTLPISKSNLTDSSLKLDQLITELKDKQENLKKGNIYTRSTTANSDFSNNNDNIFNQIKEKIDIIDIIQFYHEDVNKEYKTTCPFHNETKSSLSINTIGQYFNCFGCDKAGDAIKFVSLLHNINNYEAARKINKDFKLGVDFSTYNLEIQQDLNVFDKLDSLNKFKGLNKFEDETQHFDHIEYKNNYYDLSNEIGSGYYLTRKGFIKRSGKIDSNNENTYIFSDKCITPIVLVPNKIVLVDDSEEMEILGINGKYEKLIIAENENFSSTTRFRAFLKKFFKAGSWFDGEIKDLTNYEKYISIYVKSAKIERIKSINSFGWNEDNTKFNPYGADIFIKESSPVKQLEKAFNVKGDFEAWKKKISLLMENEIFNFLFSASLASPLVKILYRPSFWVHNYAKFSGGKTPSLLAACSIWGDPDKLMQSFDTTKNGLEFLLSTMGNLPICLDDDSLLDKYYKENPDKLIYLATNSKGKTRGTINGEVQKYKSWKLNVISNGENSLLTMNSAGGANKRCMELYGQPIPDNKEGKRCHLFFRENYGFYGEQYINTVKENKERLIDFCYYLDEFFKDCKNIETHILDVSTVCVANYIFLIDCLGYDPDEAKARSIRLGSYVLDILPSDDEIDKNKKALELIRDFVTSNITRFKENCPIGQIGYIHDKQVFFFPNELKKLLKEWYIPEKDFFTYAKEKNIILTNKDGYFVNRKYKNVAGQKIVFIKEFLEINE